MPRTWSVQKARPEDIAGIAELVATVGGDLEDLRAEQFVVARQGPGRVRGIGEVIGCGRLKPYPGFCELASLAVAPEWRASGVGREIVDELLKIPDEPVYLLCEDDVVEFFRRFGFTLIPMSKMLTGLQSKWERYLAEAGHINVMRRY